MKVADPKYEIAEFIRESTAILPECFQVGVVAYATEVITVISFDEESAQRERVMSQIEYKGYSNAGEGLAQALRLFSDDEKIVKRIVLISDGELAMPDQEAEEQSYSVFQETLKEIKAEGILIDMLRLGEEIPEEESILPELEVLTVTSYSLSDAGELTSISGEYLFDMAEMTPLSIGKLNGREAQMSVSLPDMSMERAKIFLLGKQPDASVNISSKARDTKVEYGPGFTVVILDRPAGEEVELSMNASDEMDVSVYLSAEYKVQIESEHKYDVEGEKVCIYLDILTPEKSSLVSGHLKNEKNLQIYINEQQVSAKVVNGQLYAEYPMDAAIYHPGETASLDLRITLPETYGLYYGTVFSELSVEVVPIEEEPKADWFLISVVIILAVSLTLLFIWFRRKKRYRPVKPKGGRQISFPSEEPEERSRYDYCGKINIYVLKSSDGIEYPPSSINLFARCHRETITLRWILDICDLTIPIREADKIIIKPGEGRSLLIKNNSKATALKGRDVMTRSRQYQLYFHEKVTFVFEDKGDITELEVHYKDLK